MTQQHSSPAYERKRCRCAKLAARILRGRDSGWATWICLCRLDFALGRYALLRRLTLFEAVSKN